MLSPDELAAVLRGHGLGAVDGDEPRRVSARVLHLARTGVAIKVLAPEHRAGAHAEASLLAHLRGGNGEGYRVLRLVPTVSGEPPLPLGGRHVLVTRWEEGTHRSYREIDAETWATLGRTLAALHLRLDEAPPLPLPSLVARLRARSLDDDRRILDEHERHARARQDEGARILRPLLQGRRLLLERHATAAQQQLPPDDLRPIHNDYNVHNYLFHAHGPPIILDWERAIHAPREYEVCRCLNHLPLVMPTMAWAFVDGYLQRRTLDPERIEWALHASIAAHALKHWPVQPWLAGEPGAAERLAGMAELVEAFAHGAAELDAFADRLRERIHQRGER